MSRPLRWPTLETAIRATSQNLYQTGATNDWPTACRWAERYSLQLTVAACDPYEVCPVPKEFHAFYNPATNTLYYAYFEKHITHSWVWNNTDFHLEDHPILEFHHDFHLRTLNELLDDLPFS